MDETERSYTKKGGPAPVKTPEIVVPADEEHIVIPVDMLAAAKAKLTNAEQVAQEVAKVGITVVKVMGMALALSDAAEKAEADVRDSLRQILVVTNTPQDKFKKFDFDKGVVVVVK